MAWLGNLMENVLTVFYDFTGSYGLSIVLFTLFVRGLLFPLANKQHKSMKMMQKLQPIMDVLKEEYADDKEKFQQETMRIYQKYKVNPIASCLPMLLQMPIIFALFRTLREWEKLIGESFLFIDDLSEPSIVLVVITGLIMLAQGYVTQQMSGRDSKIAMFMPIFIIVIGFNLPAGVLVYWSISTAVMVLQQYVIHQQDFDDDIDVEAAKREIKEESN